MHHAIWSNCATAVCTAPVAVPSFETENFAPKFVEADMIEVIG